MSKTSNNSYYPVLNKLNSFINWLETKDPNEEYNYLNPNTCLVARFYKETNVGYYTVLFVGRIQDAINDNDYKHILTNADENEVLEYIACCCKVSTFEHTKALHKFKDALALAKDIQSKLLDIDDALSMGNKVYEYA
jgi:hypothetical protein